MASDDPSTGHPRSPVVRHRAGAVARHGAAPTAELRRAAFADPDRPPARLTLRLGAVALLGILVTVGALLVSTQLHHPASPQVSPQAAAPAPTVSYSDPPWPKPLETLPRASRSAPSPSASATPSASTEAVLLGPADGGRLQPSLTAYCRQSSEAGAVAVPTDVGWACRAPAAGDGTIDMDRVCRWYYGDDAWAATLDDNDEFSWRCYRD